MQRAKVIAKQPPMPPADEAAAGSSIGFGRRGHGGKSHAVQGAEQGGRGMTEEIRNPAKLPTNLNPAEKEFARCLAEGGSLCHSRRMENSPKMKLNPARASM